MKKLIAIIMTVIFCFSFAACAEDISTDGDASVSIADSQPQVQQTESTTYACAIRFKINPEFEIQLDDSNFVVNLDCLNDDAQKIFSNTNVVGMEGSAAIDVLLTDAFNSELVKETVTVYVLPQYQKETTSADQLVKEIPALILNAKEKASFPYDVSVELTDPHAETTTDIPVESASPDAETTASDDSTQSNRQESAAETESQAVPQVPTLPYKQNVLYRADFDIPDVHGTGYTNLIDYYNAYPDGQDGGTFANASLMVHYREDMDKDLSLADSLAFRTYRGIGLGSDKNDVFTAYGTTDTQAPFPEVMGIGDAQHTVTSFVEYRARIASGACVGIRFYFDQNGTVMFIDYSAVYLKYAGNISDSSLYPLNP